MVRILGFLAIHNIRAKSFAVSSVVKPLIMFELLSLCTQDISDVPENNDWLCAGEREVLAGLRFRYYGDANTVRSYRHPRKTPVPLNSTSCRSAGQAITLPCRQIIFKKPLQLY